MTQERDGRSIATARMVRQLTLRNIEMALYLKLITTEQAIQKLAELDETQLHPTGEGA